MLITSRAENQAYVCVVELKEAAMRKVLMLVFTVLVSAAAAEVVAAPARSIAVTRFYYAMPIGTIHVATPSNMKGFSPELLPQ